MRHPHVRSAQVRNALLLSVTALLLILNTSTHQRTAAKTRAQQPAVVTISAASFEANALAPGAIVAAFGAGLATGTEASSSVPLPTALAGTSVRVRDSAGTERAAGLFFVSPGQINFVIPEATATGAATLTVLSGAGTTSTGTLDVKAVAPAIFTANADGTGAPAAVIQRFKANGEQSFETVAQFDAALGRMRPRPLDLSPVGDRVFLLLFFTGTLRAADPNNDGNRQESVRLLLGGVATTPDFAGAQGGLAGLDQMNIELPRGLIGSGRVSLSVTSTGVGGGLTSNLVEIEIASPPGNAPPAVNGFSAATVLAGQTVEIQGNGFAATAANNLVRIGGVEAVVTNATTTRLTVVVPFGVETGVVSVRTPQGEGRSGAALRIRASISGVVENTERQPLKDVIVRVRQANVSTGLSGSFVLPDPQGSALGAIVEVDGSKLPVSPPFGKVSFLLPFTANRDNQVARPITLQQTYGASAQVGGQNVQNGDEDEITLTVPAYAPNETEQTPPQIQTGEVTLGLPVGMRFQFPDGATGGMLTLTQIEKSRTPVSLPNGVFSSTIIQITPFGTKFTPGARLTFPNADGFAAGATVRLYRLDQTADSATLGRFIDSGAAMVSTDGKQILTPNGTVPEATYYFAALARTTTTVTGRVLDSDRTPARRALVRVRGQEDFTDGNGGFVLRNVPVASGNDVLTVEASFVRPNFRVDRTESNRTVAIAGGITDVGTLTLPAATSNQPPYILIPPELTLIAGTTRDVIFVAADPDSEQPVQVIFSGPSFVRLQPDNRTLRFSPGVNDVGLHGISLTVTDASGAGSAATFLLTVVRGTNQAPVLSVPGAQTVQPGQPLNFTVSATDADAGQTLVYTASNLPAGASFTAATRQFSWTPAATQTGNFTVTFTVTDNGTPPLSDSKQVAITVASTATTGTVTGTVRNAATGQPLAGAVIGIANSSLSATSAATGAYTLSNVQPGARTLTATATGFAATQLAITVVAGQTLTQNISLSPTLATGQLRITVNWTKDANGAPDDLDAHLYGPAGADQCFHVYWDDTGSLTAAPFASLEVDNIELAGHPPTETVRIAQQTPGIYRFFINDYGSEFPDGIARSRATVQIFGSSGLLRSYVAPSGAGEFWHVFELNGQTGALTDINQLAAEPPTFTCGNNASVVVVDHRTSAGPIPANCVAPAAKTSYLITDALVYQWTSITGATSGDTVRWDFIQPSGAVNFTRSFPLTLSGGVCFWQGMNIAGDTAAALPGNWQARVYYKDVLIATDNFTINRASAAEVYRRLSNKGVGKRHRAP